MDVDIKDLQAGSSLLCDTTTGDKAKDSPLFHTIKLILNIVHQKPAHLIYTSCIYH